MGNKTAANIGRIIRQQRWLSGITQEQLAQEVSLLPSQLRSVERGETEATKADLHAIANKLGLQFPKLKN